MKTCGMMISGAWVLTGVQLGRLYYYFRKSGGIFGTYYTPGVFSAIDKTGDMLDSGAKSATKAIDNHGMKAEHPTNMV